MVAEKNSVWRSAGMAAMMRLIVGRKPMSSMRSASSSTSMRTLPSAISPRLRKSYSLPGVAMITCDALTNGLQLRFFADAADHDGGANRAAGWPF